MRQPADSGGRTIVDPGALRALGGEVCGIGSTVGNAHSKGKNQLTPTSGAGSAAVAATRLAAERWYMALAATASRLAAAGTNLTAAANAYRGTDRQAADAQLHLHQWVDPDTGRPVNAR
ncbi:hypothetical protein [Longispora urticae]